MKCLTEKKHKLSKIGVQMETDGARENFEIFCWKNLILIEFCTISLSFSDGGGNIALAYTFSANLSTSLRNLDQK